MSKSIYDCVVVGDVMFDVFVRRNAVKLDHLQNGTSYCDFAKIDFGGAGNVASGLSFLGAKVFFIGSAGNDSWGKLYFRDLSTNGVTARIFFEKHVPTGLSIVSLDPNGERSFMVSRGANDLLTVKEVERSLDTIKSSKYLYFSGYSLVADPQKSAILRAIEYAKRIGIKIFFDPGAHNLAKSNLKLFTRLFDLSDVFCPNASEAKAMTRSRKLETAIIRLKKTGKLVALKCGSEGCMIIDDDKCIKVPGFGIKCVDTTGAGDAFAAALIYGLTRNFPSDTAGKLANWFASRIVAEIGARNFPGRRDLLRFERSLRLPVT